MCTLTLAFQAFDTAPIVVAANRDEQTNRPSTPPHKIGDDPPIIAPVDDKAGGTWIGYNAEHLFVAITNRWLDESVVPDRSRGLLVMDVLEQRTLEQATATVERAVSTHTYDGFNLLVASPTGAVLYEWSTTLHTTDLDPGVHVIMNAGFDDHFDRTGSWSDARSAQADNAARLRTELTPKSDETPEHWLDRAASRLADHSYGVCIHADGFGTRSSSLIVLRADGQAQYRYADGPPCRTPYSPVNDHI